MCASASFNAVYVFSGEVFPTSVRGAGFGLCNVAARVGGLLAPFSMVMPLTLLFSSYAAVAAAAALGTLRYLEETLGAPLRQHMDEDRPASERCAVNAGDDGDAG